MAIEIKEYEGFKPAQPIKEAVCKPVKKAPVKKKPAKK